MITNETNFLKVQYGDNNLSSPLLVNSIRTNIGLIILERYDYYFIVDYEIYIQESMLKLLFNNYINIYTGDYNIKKKNSVKECFNNLFSFYIGDEVFSNNPISSESVINYSNYLL